MNQNFTEGKILLPLLRFAFPVLLASLIQTLYGAVDLLILGKFGTASDISAVSTGDRMMQTVTTIFIVAYNVIGSIFRGLGDSCMPLITVAISCGLNIAGDLVLVGGLGLGVTGAAAATVAAQASSVLLSLLIIKRRSLPFAFSAKMIRYEREYVGKILNLGMPVAFQNLLINISFLVLTAVINTLGLAASAGVGIASKVIGFVMLVPSAFAQSSALSVSEFPCPL